MKQLTYIKKGTVKWWDVPEPTLQTAEDAIVRPLAASRCDGDCAFLFFNLSGILKVGTMLHIMDPLGKELCKGPFPIGHECVAEIISCGENVKNFSVGQKVIVPWSVSCGHCQNCKQGLTSKCSAHSSTVIAGYGFGKGSGGYGGMVSDLLRVPHADAMLVAVPSGMDPTFLAPASDNLPDAWRTVGPQLKKNPQAPVLIMGGGAKSIGLYAAGMAVALGSSHVDYMDFSQTRLDIAQSLGANPIRVAKKSAWFKQGKPALAGGYPIAVDAGSYPGAVQYALRALAPGGICTSTGFYFRKGTPLPLWQMYLNESTFHIGISNPRADVGEVLKLIEAGRFKPEKVTTLVANWDDAEKAYLEHCTKLILKRDSIFNTKTK